MSFGGIGGAEETLSYYIRAADQATPIFKAFGQSVQDINKAVIASIGDVTKALEDQQAAMKDMAATAKESAAATAKSSGAMDDAAGSAGALAGSHDDAKGSMQDASKAADEHASALGDLGNAAAVASAKTGELDDTEKDLGKTLDDTSDVVARHEALLNDAANAAGVMASRAGEAEDAQRDLGTETAKTSETLDDSAKASKSAAAGAAALGTSMAGAGGAHETATPKVKATTNAIQDLGAKMKSAGSTVSSVGSDLMKVSAPLAAVGLGSVYLQEKFGAAMEEVHTQAGYSQAAVDSLSKQVLAAAGPFAQTPEALATGLYHIASVGIPASQAMNILKAASVGANISGADFDDTANALVSTMKNFPNTAGGAQAAMAELSSIVGAGNMHMQDLVSNLGKVVPAGKAFGLTLDDIGAGLDVMTGHGMAANQSTTALKMAITTMGAPSTTAIAQLEKIGLSSTQLADDMRKPNGLLVAFEDLKTHLDATFPPGHDMTVEQKQTDLDNYAKSLEAAGVSGSTLKADVMSYQQALESSKSSAVQQAQVLSHAFGGGRTGAGVMLLTQNIKDLRRVYNDLPQGAAAIKKLSDAQAAWEQTTQGQMDHVKAALAATGVEVGQSLVPIVVPAFKEIGDIVVTIADGFEKLPAPVKDATVALLTLGAVAGPVLKIVGGLINLGGGLASGVESIANKLGWGGASETPKPGAPVTPSGTGLGQEITGGGIWGADGTQIRVGSAANPIAVMVASTLAAGGGAAADEAAVAGEDTAIASETRSPGGVILPPGVNPTADETTAVRGRVVTPEEMIPAVAPAVESEVSDSLGSTLKGAISDGMGSLMKGGMIAGMGVAGSQLAGSMIGGTAGKDVSSIGTDASIGAAAGSFIGPEGTLAGGVVGALAGAFTTFFDGSGTDSAWASAQKFGKDLSDSVTSALPGSVSASTSKALASSLANVHYDQGQIATGQKNSAATYGASTVNAGSYQVDESLQATQAGQQAGQAFIQGFSSVKFKTTSGVLSDLTSEMSALPASARAQAALTALQYAQGLTDSGDLPKTAMTQIISGIEGQFPGLLSFLGTNSTQIASQIATDFKLSQAQQNLQQTITTMQGQFGVMQGDTKVTSDNMLSQFTDAFSSIKTTISDSSGKARDAAVADFQSLQTQAVAYMQTMEQKASASMTSLTGAIKSGSSSAQASATSDFSALASNIAEAISGGTIATAQGMTLIGQALNSELKSFGAKTIPAVALRGETASELLGELSFQTAGSTSSRAAGGQFAAGGRVPGPVGPDNWTLVDPSGRAAGKVGGGELLIANRHTEAKASAATMALYGQSLGQMVTGETTPHSAPGYATGGVVESYGQLEGLWDQAGGPSNMAALMAAIAEAESRGSSTAENPSGASGLWQILGQPFAGNVFDPLTNARMAVAKWRSQGLTAWATYTSGAYRQFLQGNIPANLNGGGGGGGATWTALKAPTVSGGGAIASIANAALAQATKAANAKGSAAAAAAGGSGAVSLIPGGRTETAPKGASSGLEAMINEANSIASHDYNYEWGGGHGSVGVPSHGVGHGSGPGVGFDCSGAVSAVLNAAGLVTSPMTASQYMTWGLPGPGSTVSIFADPTHTFMELSGHYFGTSYGNPGGGANWMTSFPGNIGGPRHPQGYSTGGFVVDPTQLPQPIRDGILPGMATGGIAYAGMFGGGGTVTADRPTMAVFGDNGPETAMFLPHAATGLTLPAGVGGSATTSSTKTAKIHYSTKLNPLTDQIETHTTAEWQYIDAEVAQERALAKIAKQKLDAYLAGQTSVGLIAGTGGAGMTISGQRPDLGIPLAGLTGTRKQMAGYGLPLGGNASLASAATLSRLTATGYRAVTSQVKTDLGKQDADQINATMKELVKALTEDTKTHKSATVTTRAAGLVDTAAKAGAAAVATKFSAQGTAFGTQMSGLEGLGTAAGYTSAATYTSKTILPAYQKDVDQLTKEYGDALKTHNKGLQAALTKQIDTVKKAEADAIKEETADKVSAVKATVATQAGFGAAVAAAGGIGSAISSLAPGTNLSSLGLSPSVLASLGVSNVPAEGSSVSYLENQISTTGAPLSAGDMAAAAATTAAANQNDQGQMAALEAQMQTYQAAIANKTLTGSDASDATAAMQSLASQILALQSNMQDNTAAMEQLTAANVQATEQQYSTAETAASGASSIVSLIQGLAPGTDLSALGLSPSVLAAAGVTGGAEMEGSSMSYIQQLEQQQGGELTPAQMAAAASGVTTANAGLTAQEQPIEQEIAYLQSEMPNLSGSDLTSAQQTYQQLIAQLLGLQTTIQQNNTALTNLTAATTANTNATGQMTGTVGYTYQGQNYVAGLGGSMTSDSAANITVGL